MIKSIVTNSCFTAEGIVVIEIPEALPRTKVGLMPEDHERWLNYIHYGLITLAHNNDNCLPMFDKALVGIHIVTKKESDRGQLWDVSNRALNLVINVLKVNLFPDDNFKHMSLMITGDQDENEKTLIYVGDFKTCGNEILSLLQRQIYGSKAS